MSRFTLRGRSKFGMQWQLYCPVHNIERIACRAGWGYRLQHAQGGASDPAQSVCLTLRGGIGEMRVAMVWEMG